MSDAKEERLVSLQTMYIKDVSFEAPNSPGVFLEEAVSPETKINLANTHDKIGDDSYDVCLKVGSNPHTVIKRFLSQRLSKLVCV